MDLDEILTYSWDNFPSTSEQFGTALLKHLEVLKDFPYVGVPLSGHSGVRQLVHTPIIVTYRVLESASAVEILEFRHASRRPFRS